jgi:hypothetical protein
MIRSAMARPACFSSALAACWVVSAWCAPPAVAYGQAGLAVYTMNADGSDVKRIYHAAAPPGNVTSNRRCLQSRRLGNQHWSMCPMGSERV